MSPADLLPLAAVMNLVFGALLVRRFRFRRDPVGAVLDLLRQGQVAGVGRIRVNAYQFRTLSVPMICELAELEGFGLVGEEIFRNSLFLIFQRRGDWGGRPSRTSGGTTT